MTNVETPQNKYDGGAFVYIPKHFRQIGRAFGKLKKI